MCFPINNGHPQRGITISLAMVLVVFVVRSGVAQSEASPPARASADWIHQLSDESARVRNRATDALIKIGADAVEPVCRLLNSPDLEIAYRARQILIRIALRPDPKHSQKVISTLDRLGRESNDELARITVGILTMLHQTARAGLKMTGAGINNQHGEQGPGILVSLTRWRGGSPPLARLRFLEPVYGIDLSQTRLENDDLVPLSASIHLVSLNLRETSIDDDGLRPIQGLTRLRDLNLRRTLITDDGLSSLAELTALIELDLSGTSINGRGLIHLSRMASLRSLNLKNTRMDDAGLKHLAGLVHLKKLWLSYTNLNGTGLQHLTNLKELETLALSGTEIDDDAVAQLQELTGLRSLWLTRTKISSDGLERLKQALPNTSIYR